MLGLGGMSCSGGVTVCGVPGWVGVFYHVGVTGCGIPGHRGMSHHSGMLTPKECPSTVGCSPLWNVLPCQGAWPWGDSHKSRSCWPEQLSPPPSHLGSCSVGSSCFRIIPGDLYPPWQGGKGMTITVPAHGAFNPKTPLEHP